MDLYSQKRIAEHFDRMYEQGIAPWKNHPSDPALAKFFRLLKTEKPKAKILDLGCGDGWVSIEAAKKGFSVWGIDTSDTAIESAKKEAKSQKVEARTDFQVGNALDLPYKGSYFDAMIDRGLLHHILPGNRLLYLENVLRILKKEALIYLAVFSQKNPIGIGQLFDRELVKDLFEENFAVISHSEDPYPTSAPAHLLHFILKRKS